jgi:hypothetical protein
MSLGLGHFIAGVTVETLFKPYVLRIGEGKNGSQIIIIAS